MKGKIKLSIILFIMGFLGVLTLLTMPLPIANLPEPLKNIPILVIKMLTLIQPTFLLFISVLVGILLYNRVGLTVPTISALLKIEKPKIFFSNQIKFGIPIGIISGLLIYLISYLFSLILDDKTLIQTNNYDLTILMRFLYGGITEEIMMRFGLMTFFVWIVFIIIKKQNSFIYWFGIILSSIIFGLGHFPTVYLAVGNPSLLLLVYILIGNSVAGLFYGWLYWKKGLEASFIAHIFTHVTMLVIGIATKFI